jgi:hypothetical protein
MGSQRFCDLLLIKATAPVPDPPSDVLGELLPAPGAGGGDTETAWWRGQGAQCAHRRGQDRPNGGGPEAGDEDRADLSPLYRSKTPVQVGKVLFW